VLLAVAIIAAVFWLPSPWGLAAIIGALVVELAEIGLFLWYSKRRRVTTGAEAVVGAVGLAVTRCDPEGQIRVEGELWNAYCADGAEPGDRVAVQRLDGLTLIVAPVHSARG
jgi:membrane-bound serine protease (ClpP class)